MYKLGLEEAEKLEIKLPKFVGSWRKQQYSRKKIYICFVEHAQAFDCVGHNELWKIRKQMEVPDHLTCLLRSLYADQEATVRSGHKTTVCSKLGSEYCKALYCHAAYLTHMQCTTCKILGWKNHNLELRYLGESTTSDMHMIPLCWQKVKRN